MAESLRLPHSASGRRMGWRSRKLYLGLGLVNAAIWGTAFFYLQVAPRTYTSEWTVVLPRGGEQAKVNLPNVGSATSSIQSPYSGSEDDPRENYAFLAKSESVREAAAAILNTSFGEFGTPRVTNTDNTTLMEFEVEGDSPKAAQLKSFALYQALGAKLVELRAQEADTKEEGLQATLSSSQNKLKNAQKRLFDFKARSNLGSTEQIGQLSSNIEKLQEERAQALVQLNQTDARSRQLSNASRLSAQKATEAFRLQADPYFQQVLSEYSDSSAALVDLNSKFTPNNPTVIDVKAKRDASRAALLARSQSLLKKPVTLEYIEQLSLKNSSPREQLSQNLVTAQADKQGLQAQAQELEQQTALFQHRLKGLSQQQIIEADLRRDVEMAEVIFSFTLTQLNLRDSDIFGSYPQIQLIEEPTLPKSPSSPNTVYVLLGAGFSSLFLTTALILLSLSKREDSIPKRVRTV